jgi:DnaJ-class molecular chaperone
MQPFNYPNRNQNLKARQIQDEQNQLNRLHNIKYFQSRGECPFCEGYGELFDSSDLEEPHKDCHYCGGSGDWETTENPEELHKKYPFLG